MANQDDLQETLKLGIEAVRRGDKQAAEMLLRQVVNGDPNNELAWMWLASAVDSVEERRRCLENALRINPNNARAQEALSRLGGGSASPRSPERATGGRRRAVNRPQQDSPRDGGRVGVGGSVVPVIVAAVAVVAVIAAVVFGLVFAQQNNVLNPPTPVDPELAAAAAFNPTNTPMPDPETFTDTPTPPRVIVTMNPDEVTLPPTFTPTFTPSPEPTLTPSATPYPVAAFELIYTSIIPGQAESNLYAAVGDGSQERELRGNIRDVVYDPTGQQIAFVQDVSVGDGEDARTISELFIAPVADPSDARQVTTLESSLSSPTWSPDGVQLAFTSDFSGTEQIWVITEDGNNARQLTTHEGINRSPSWSPVGDTLIYASDQNTPGTTKIFSIGLDGENPVQLGSLSGNSYTPRWSLDGSLIAFVNDSTGDSDIYTMSPDGTNQQLLTTDDNSAEDRAPAFTPNGEWIGFASNRESANFQLYVVDLRGNVVQRITQTDRDDQALDFFPDVTFRLRQN